MPLIPGTKVGPYQVTASIGAGGMGEVYRALDPSLDRDVAIKVLPEFLANDPERVARFSREAKTLAALNHPNVAHIHGVVELPPEGGSHVGGSHTIALVMEFVDGEDLAQWLARGPIQLDEAIPIAKQIADALECAHEQGIVHRDLKPANVKLRPDGMVKVLDFGLAKALNPVESGTSSSALMLSPTFTSPAMTQLGIILGTAAYMAPEQARGKAVDKRADIWAFGALLFEMLSGKRAFEGSEVSDTLAFVLTKEPDWNALPNHTPAPIRRLLKRCLQKDRKQRLADISDARLDLDEALWPSDQPTLAAAPAGPGRWRAPAIAAAVLGAAVLGGFAGIVLRSPAPAPLVTRFIVPLPEGQEFTNTGRHFIAVSPDGARIVYVANQQLHVRSTSSFVSQPIPGSAIGSGVVNPVFSPDGESIAFYADNAIRKIPVAGGTPFTVAESVNPFGMFWADNGIYLGAGLGGIVRVPAGGGKPEEVSKVEPGEMAQGPQVLPDGETLIFTTFSTTGEARFDKGKIVAQSLRTGERKLLYEGGSDAQVLPTGHLVFANSGVLYAVTFDVTKLQVTGMPVPVLEGVRRSGITGAMHYRVAANGTLIYVPGPAASDSRPRALGLIDRSGKLVSLPLPQNAYETPRLSPDGSRIAVGIVNDTEADIWIQDLPVKAALRRLTFGGRNRFPVWSRDGRRIAFQSNRDGTDSIYVQEADVSGAAQLLYKAEAGSALIPESWSPDGQWLGVTVAKANTAQVHVLSLKDRKLSLFAAAPKGGGSRGATFAPDGKWLAYSALSDTGVPGTFIEPFPQTGAKYQIANGGQPAWSADGRELLVAPRLPTFSIFSVSKTPRVTFAEVARPSRVQSIPSIVRAHDFDGKQILTVLPSTTLGATSRDINVVLNWFEELKK